MKKSSRYFTIAFIILFTFTAIFFSIEKNQKLFISWLDNIKGKDKEIVEMSYFMGSDLIYYNGRYVSWNGERVSYLDDRGEVLWSRTFLVESPKLKVKDGKIAVFSKEGEVFVYGMDGKPLIELKLEEPVFDVAILDKDLIVHLKTTDSEILELYDKNGSLIKQMVYKNESPVGYWRDQNGEINISIINLNSNVIKSRLQKDGDDEPIIQLEGDIILSSIPYGGSKLILTDEGIKLLKKGKLVWERDFPLIKDVVADGEDIYVLYGDNLELLDGHGETVKKATNPIDYKKIHIHGRYVILYGRRDLQVMRDGEILATYSTGGRIKWLDSQFNDLIVTMEEGISVMRIKDKEIIEEDNNE